jgi:hypothetical protein
MKVGGLGRRGWQSSIWGTYFAFPEMWREEGGEKREWDDGARK